MSHENYTTSSVDASQEFSATSFMQRLESLRPKGASGVLLMGEQHDSGGISPHGFIGPCDPERMTHVNTGTFDSTGQGWSERTNYATGTAMLVLDDVGDKVEPNGVEPTAVIETRAGSQQWIYLYNELVPLELGAGMATAVANAGLSDEFIKGRSHHWFRLPNSLPPQKAAERIERAREAGVEPDMTPARLVAFSGRTFGYWELAGLLGVSPVSEDIGGYSGTVEFDPETGEQDPILLWMGATDRLGRGRPDMAGWRDIMCPNGHNHTNKRPWGRYVPSNAKSRAAFMCHHSGCLGLKLRDLRQWSEREGGPTVAQCETYARQVEPLVLPDVMPEVPPAFTPPEPVRVVKEPEVLLPTTVTEVIQYELRQLVDLSPLEIDTRLAEIAEKYGRTVGVLRRELSAITRQESVPSTQFDPADGYTVINGQLVANFQSTKQVVHDMFGSCIAFDLFANRPVVLQALPNEPALTKPRFMEDNDFLTVWGHIQLNQPAFARVGKDLVKDGMKAVAYSSKFHPIQDYLRGLPAMDTGDILDTWLTRFLKADGDEEYLREVGRRWLISAVARVMSPGCQADSALILEGNQGVGKSSALRILASDDYFGDALPNFHDKDASQYLAGKWIIEMAELTSVLKSEMEDMRSFLTRRAEDFRGAYKELNTLYLRQCVFAGSTNRTDYLRDPEGERRMWPVHVASEIDLEGLASHRDMLWKAAFDAYQNGEPWHLSRDVATKANTLQKDRLADDIWIEILETRLGQMRDTCVRQCVQFLKEAEQRVDGRAAEMRIADCLRRLGFEKGTRRLFATFGKCVIWERKN